MSVQTPITQKPSSARRRLLRGAFAVPALMTVHSGSALANSSNPLRCFAKTDDVPGVEDSAFIEGDSFKRVALGRLDIGSNKARYFVDGNNIVAVATALGVNFDTSFIAADQYRRFNIQKNEVTGNIRKKCPVPPESSSSDTSMSSTEDVDVGDEETVSEFIVARQSDALLAGACSSAYSPNGGKFAVLMFDSLGTTIIGVGGDSGVALVGSCWASLSP